VIQQKDWGKRERERERGKTDRRREEERENTNGSLRGDLSMSTAIGWQSVEEVIMWSCLLVAE
jgi:hypothetical protein